MGSATRITGIAVASVLAVATTLTGCSKSSKSPAANLTALAKAAGTQQAAAAGGGSTGNATQNGGTASASGDSSILGDNPGCHLLSASDVKNAVGKDLPSLTGNLGGGMEGNTGHQSCTYTADNTGHGADVNVEVNTFVGTAKDQLNKMRQDQQDQVDSDNQIAANSATLKDASVGDGGFEIDIHSSQVNDESVWFTKGDKVVNVEVGDGQPGGALQLAQELAGKV
jgi:hypothetical protein